MDRFEKPYLVNVVRHSSTRWRRIQRLLKRFEAIVEHAARMDGLARHRCASEDQAELDEEHRLLMYRRIDKTMDRLEAAVIQEISTISQERLLADVQAQQKADGHRVRRNANKRITYAVRKLA